MLYLQGLAFAALTRYDDAVDVYTLALARERPAAEIYDRLAEAQLLAGHPREAADAVAKAMALEPNRQQSRRNLPTESNWPKSPDRWRISAASDAGCPSCSGGILPPWRRSWAGSPRYGK